MMDALSWLLSKASVLLTAVGPSMLAVASFMVALVALNINYRNSNGWKPVVLVTRWYFSESAKTSEVWLNASLEVWNRRRYPILIRAVRLRIDPVKYERLRDPERFPENKLWQVAQGNSVLEVSEEQVLQPSSFASFKVAAVCDQSEPFPHRSKVIAKAMIFDPKKNKHIVVERRSELTEDSPSW